MVYLKLIANAAWAGAYGSLLIALLLLFLNDGLAAPGLLSGSFLGLLLGVAVIYVPIISVVFPTLFVFLRFFAARRLGIGWASLKAIVWIGAATLGALTVVFHQNLRSGSSLLSPAAQGALRSAFTVMAVCWLLAVGAAGLGQFNPGARGTRWRRLAGGLLLVPLPMMAALTARASQATAPAPPGPRAAPPTPARAPGVASAPRGEEPRSLIVVGIEAASMDCILPLVSARELPMFERLLKEGAAARLNTIRPCVALVAWTTLATGMPPWATGVRDNRTYALWPLVGRAEVEILPRGLGMTALARAGYLGARPRAAEESRRPRFWEILTAAGIETEVIGWSAGAPAGVAPGRVLEGAPRVSRRLERILDAPPEGLAAGHDALLQTLRRAIALDLTAIDAALAARPSAPEGRSRVLAVMLPGLALVSRHFLRYHLPAEFGDVRPQDQASFGKVLARYYEFVDELVADLVLQAGPRSYAMVVSAHGVEPVQGWERLAGQLFASSEAGAAGPSGSWRRGPDGVMMVHGAGIARGAKMEEADLEDVVPTILYVLGLPIGRDLRGGLLRRMFDRDFLESHPVQLIPGSGPPS